MPQSPEQTYFADTLAASSGNISSLPKGIKVEGAAAVGDPKDVLTNFSKSMDSIYSFRKVMKTALILQARCRSRLNGTAKPES